MSLKTRLQLLAQAVYPQVVATRRDLHRHPELAFEEVRTAGVVAQRLTELGIPYQTGVAHTGVVAIIEGNQKGKTVALRADMDALPILEENEVDYCSQHPGKMHACGHDAHTASLLGTAHILMQVRDQIPGIIKLIFQPSEEKLPGGASVMVKEGVLKNPDVHTILGQHVMPQLPVGVVGIRPGMYMASTDEIYITVHGRGGHGAMPHTTTDPVLIGAHLIVALQQVVSRIADPRTPSVLTIGKVTAQGATNVIPEKVVMEGTFRSFNETWRTQAHKRITQIAHGVVEGMGGKLDLEIRRGYPVLYNDEQVTARARRHIVDYVGADRVVDLDLWTAAEDFAFYTHQIPGCFYRIGTRNEAQGIVHGLHTPRMNIDETALQTSTGLMAWLAIKELES